MKDANLQINPARFWLLLVPLVLIIAGLVVVESFEAAGSGELRSATYSNGTLHLAIPYHANDSGTGQLTMEVLDPEDQILGRAQRHVDAARGTGLWREDIKLKKSVSLDELVWHRVRYRFEYSDGKRAAIEGVDSISQILRTPVLHILGQQSYLTGGQAAVRVIVTDSKNEVIAGRGSVQIELLVPDQKSRVLFSGELNHAGTAEAQFRFPAGLVGSYQLRYVVDTPIGSTEFTQPVRLEDKVSILLTTEKPIYRPGQTIHVRALALDRSNHEAAADHRLTFELEDSRGNKVFKKVTATDKFGIGSAEFALADEVNLGTYHLRALMGEGEAPTNTAEIALNVEKYMLPKFKVAVDLAGKDNKAKRGYRPGDHVTGSVHANYFFGKPVDGAEITVKASGMDVAVFEVGSVQGKTDRDGTYHFDLTLPNYFAGRPLTQGGARVLIEATVRDSAGHAETRGEPIMVSESSLLITAVPEGGTLVPNLENQVFLLASYPDGTPAVAKLRIHAEGTKDQYATADDGGVAVIRISSGTGVQTLKIDADDKDGNHASSTIQLQTREGEDQILLRTDRAVYRAGDRIALSVFSTKKRGTAYLDIVKEGQTVLTRDLEIENGRAELSLAVTPELAGTVDFNAYLFGSDARPVGDHRLVFVQPADELKIEAAADAPVYKPGDEARIRFRVTNARGEGVRAALGVQVVDEAVFALAEKQPGFAKVFFYLEQEVMKPRYEIHSIGMPQIVEPVEESRFEQRDRAARALFSATEMVSTNKFETEFGRTVPMTKYADYATRYRARFLAQVRQLATNLNQAYAQGQTKIDLTDVVKQMARAGQQELRDAWDTNLRIEPVTWYPQKSHYWARSAGPDKQFGTVDDIAVYLEVQRRKIVGRPTSGASAIDFNVESGRGPFNGRAEVVGTVVDQRGGALEGTTVTVREISTGRTRTARANADGHFRLAAVPAGEYEVKAYGGAGTVSKKFKLEARDSATLSVFLRNEPAGTAVAVNEAIETVIINGQGIALAGVVGGVPGGVGAGVMGGVVNAPVEGREVMMLMAPAVPGPLRVSKAISVNSATLVTDGDKRDSGSPAAHVRSYFPEALYINPEIITD
ncbi:MAG: MG2 domain-containing protein, partial [Terriglobales bacterium]